MSRISPSLITVAGIVIMTLLAAIAVFETGAALAGIGDAAISRAKADAGIP